MLTKKKKVETFSLWPHSKVVAQQSEELKILFPRSRYKH